MRAGLFLLALVVLAASATAQEIERSAAATFRAETFASGFTHGWSLAFLPDGRALLTERPGGLRLVGRDGSVSARLSGAPDVVADRQGGLLGIALAPDFSISRELWLCGSGAAPGGVLTRLWSARLSADESRLEGLRTVLDAGPAQARGMLHFGCRIAFGPEGHVYLSTGERNEDRMRAQRLDDLAGKVIRLARDGSIPRDNPFVGRPGARPEIWSYGHRNPQGLAFQPGSGRLFLSEFGPRGGDEINIVLPGRNYGWPIVTHGREYWGGRISSETSRPGMEDPLFVWTPSVSPSGIAFYEGAAFPGWRGSLFVAALNTPGLVRLSVEGARITGEERLLWGRTRLRDVAVGPEGFLYLVTDEREGRILRLVPAE
ncbi:MAG: PQQ-dependent sugar dehydrogenase [Acetobacteraceae bacterium]|nr:PQQ-dependent sugar dehydrogenase [Acetobacteraceae bacterium]MDW8398888.1 PQQ-dependent sugar dehydrogenase [Acetobacteraceae bacterium]